MDRNTVIALVLILLIWLMWGQWMGDDAETQPAPGSDSTAVTEQASFDSLMNALADSAAQAESARQAELAAAPESVTPAEEATEEVIPEREIVVSTPLYRARLSNRGAVLNRWMLKEFNTADGAPVELITPELVPGVPLPGRAMGLMVGSTTGQITDARRLTFQADQSADSVVLGPSERTTVTFRGTLPNGQEIYKTYTFLADSYAVHFSTGFTDRLQRAPLTLTWEGAVPFAEGDHSREMAGMKAMAYVAESLEDIQVTDEAEEESPNGLMDWVGIRNKYFLTAFIPQETERWNVTLKGRAFGPQKVSYGWQVSPDNLTESSIAGVIYLGPIHGKYLEPLGHNIDQAIDLGWTIIRPISRVVRWAFFAMYKFIPNYGIVIIIFSIFIKILVHPLTKKSYESTSKMQQLKPLMDELRAKHGDDSQRLNQEMMKLYKEHGFNPLGGCLPMLLQMPIIFAIYAVIGNNFEFRQAAFFGWITDLSSPRHRLHAAGRTAALRSARQHPADPYGRVHVRAAASDGHRPEAEDDDLPDAGHHALRVQQRRQRTGALLVHVQCALVGAPVLHDAQAEGGGRRSAHLRAEAHHRDQEEPAQEASQVDTRRTAG